jgi:hypothetical protein
MLPAWIHLRGRLATSYCYLVAKKTQLELRGGFGRCRWEKCRRFFLESGVRRGKKGSDYCPDRACGHGVAARVSRHRIKAGRKG